MVRALRGLVVLVVVGAACPAWAQAVAGFADDRFEPAGAGSQWMTSESLDFQGHLRPAAALTEDWAVHPLVAYTSDGRPIGPLVGEQVITHLDAALMLWDRVRVDVNVPLSLFDSGGGTQLGPQSYTAPQSHVVGDLRFGADARIVEKKIRRGRVVVAGGLQVFVPTGAPRAFNGDGGVRAWPRVMAAGERGQLVWAARLGFQYRPKDGCNCSLAPGSEITGVLAAGWRISARWMVGPELFATGPLADARLAARSTPPVELLLGGHLAVSPRWKVSAGISRGLTDGTGSPAFRAVLGVAFILPTPSAPLPPWQPPLWPSEDPAPPASVVPSIGAEETNGAPSPGDRP